MSGPQYEGWANYPTWLAHLWLTNTEVNYLYVRALAVDHGGNVQTFAAELREMCERAAPAGASEFWKDAQAWIVDMVVWEDVAAEIIGAAAGA